MHPKVVALVVVFAVSTGSPFVPRAAAGVLAPAKPSDVRVVFGSTATSPPCPGGALAVSAQQNPDGTTGAFVVPAKSVFIVTSMDWNITGGVASGIQGVSLFVQAASGASSSLLATALGQASAGGGAAGSVELPTGAVVKSGAFLCFSNAGTAGSVIVRGFIAKDK